MIALRLFLVFLCFTVGDIMDKHRADMRKFYLNKPAEFR